MKVTYDPEADAAYIWLNPDSASDMVDRTYLCDPVEVGGMVNLDIDGDGKIIGIEVLTAKALLPAELIAAAARSGPTQTHSDDG